MQLLEPGNGETNVFKMKEKALQNVGQDAQIVSGFDAIYSQRICNKQT